MRPASGVSVSVRGGAYPLGHTRGGSWGNGALPDGACVGVGLRVVHFFQAVPLTQVTLSVGGAVELSLDVMIEAGGESLHDRSRVGRGAALLDKEVLSFEIGRDADGRIVRARTTRS